jgi:predicted small integral membrane protein
VHLVGHLGNINTTLPQWLDNGQIFFPAANPAINPNFGLIAMRTTDFDSSFNSLSASARLRVARGLRAEGKFTWGKSIDNNSVVSQTEFYTAERVPTVFDLHQNRGRSDYDCPLAFTANFTYDLPAPRAPLAHVALGGWTLAGLTQAQSGNPFNPTVGFDNARLRSTSNDLGQRPNLVLGQRLILGGPRQYFNPQAFSLPAAGYLGNLGRNVLTGPSLVSTSLALERQFLRHEQRSLRIRGEMFNVANHPNFQLPSGTGLFDSTGARLGTAGRVTDTTTSARQIQLSARFTF